MAEVEARSCLRRAHGRSRVRPAAGSTPTTSAVAAGDVRRLLCPPGWLRLYSLSRRGGVEQGSNRSGGAMSERVLEPGEHAAPVSHGRPSAPDGPRFDVFLSHNSRDKPAVLQLADQLRQAGLRPWLDA